MILSCKRWHIPWESSSSNCCFISVFSTQCWGTLHRAWWWLFLLWIVEINRRLQMKACSSYSTQGKCHFCLVNSGTCLNYVFQLSCTNNLGLVEKKNTHMLFFLLKGSRNVGFSNPSYPFWSLIIMHWPGRGSVFSTAQRSYRIFVFGGFFVVVFVLWVLLLFGIFFAFSF